MPSLFIAYQLVRISGSTSDIPFGTVLDSATSLIKAKNYRFDTLRGWQIKIYGPFSLAGGDVSEALLSFNPDAGFYEGYANLQGKDPNNTDALYDRFYRIIDTKYRTRPAATKRESQKGGKRYWLDEWIFSTDMGNYSISMIRDKDVIHLTYKASNIAPQQPVAGDVHESGL
jgi:hypothetical protein